MTELTSSSSEILAKPQPDTLGVVPSVEIANPYERLSNEQLVVVRDNIADSIIEGIKKYDTTEITRASINLAAIPREFGARFADQRPAHNRGENDGAITYVTEPDPNIIQKIVDRLQTIDGAPYIAKSLYGVVNIPESSEAGMEARLQGIEQMTLFSGISKEIRRRTGSKFSPFNNPYSIMKNEDLAKIVERLKETIQTLTTQGKDTTDFRDKMMLVGKVIQSRR